MIFDFLNSIIIVLSAPTTLTPLLVKQNASVNSEDSLHFLPVSKVQHSELFVRRGRDIFHFLIISPILSR